MHSKPLMMIALNFSLVMTACQGDGPSISDSAYYQGMVHSNYSAKVRERLLPEASRIAKANYFCPDAQWKFIASFFDGYEDGARGLSGRTIIGNGKGPHQHGLDAGARYYRQADELSLMDFGYECVEVGGTFTRTNFEESAFQPDGTNETWWADFRERAWNKLIQHTSKSQHYVERARLVVHGYLDPQIGGLGHMNMYDREIVVDEIIEITDG